VPPRSSLVINFIPGHPTQTMVAVLFFALATGPGGNPFLALLLDPLVAGAVGFRLPNQDAEGIARGNQLNAVQEAFLECGGAQCGICTPGMVIASTALLEKHPHPTEAEIREGLAGNLCRCTGYQKIFAAVVRACESIANRDAGSR